MIVMILNQQNKPLMLFIITDLLPELELAPLVGPVEQDVG